MSFDHDRAARCQRRGGIPARYGKRQRKVAGAEYRDGAEGNVTLAQIRPRGRGALWLRAVYSRIYPVTSLQHLCEQAQLLGQQLQAT